MQEYNNRSFQMSIAHVGINAENKEAGEAIAKQFSMLMGTQIRETPMSYFCDEIVEVMNGNGRGTHGHIAFLVDDCEQAIAYFKAQGMELVEETRKLNEEGKCIFAYFKEEIGGFAIHLLQE